MKMNILKDVQVLLGDDAKYAKFMKDVAAAEAEAVSKDMREKHEGIKRMHVSAKEALVKAQIAAKKIEDDATENMAGIADSLDLRQKMLDRDESNFMLTMRSEQKKVQKSHDAVQSELRELALREVELAKREVRVQEMAIDADTIAQDYLARTSRLDAAMAS